MMSGKLEKFKEVRSFNIAVIIRDGA